MKSITEEEYHEAEEGHGGWCVDCEDFTRDMTESDAEGYDCPVCGNMSVIGTMNALIEGRFDLA